MYTHYVDEPEKGRGIAQLVRGVPANDCPDVRLTRVIGPMAIDTIDPFVLFEEVESEAVSGSYAALPHRGFESLCYIIEGGMRHSDNQGNDSVVEAGGAQWLTAARGVIQTDRPETDRGPFRGFRLWLNLPARRKWLRPSWRALTAADIPAVFLQDAEVRVLAGRFRNVIGPIAPRATRPFVADILLAPERDVTIPIPSGHSGFVYVFENAAAVGATLINAGQAGILNDTGSTLTLTSGAQGARALVVVGAPLGEPIVRYRQFVMNKLSEIKQALTDLENNRF